MPSVIIKHLGLADYQTTFEAMQQFTQARMADAQAPVTDEFWCVEHPSVFTQGRAGKAEHILNPTQIPVVATDRGGQVTYHGPGQLVIYPLCDLTGLNQGVQDFVSRIESAMVDYLGAIGIEAQGNDAARGVYVDGKKIGSIGLRIKKDFSYHGLSLNFDMDLAPFKAINPCGYQGLEMTQVAQLSHQLETPLCRQAAFKQLATQLAQTLGYDAIMHSH